MSILLYGLWGFMILVGGACVVLLGRSILRDREPGAAARRSTVLVAGVASLVMGALGLKQGSVAPEVGIVVSLSIALAALVHLWSIARRRGSP